MLKIVLIMLFFATSLFAINTAGTIYTYGYFVFVKDNLLALSGIVAGGNDVLIKIAMSCSFFIFLLKKSLEPEVNWGLEFGKFLMIVTFIQQMFLSAPNDTAHRYAIVDKITVQTGYVEQIPKAICEIMSLLTTLEDAMLNLMETHYSTPTSSSFRNSGLGFNISVQADIMDETITDSLLSRTFTTYYENCMLAGDFASGDNSAAKVMTSSQLRNLLSTTNTLLTVVYKTGAESGEVTTCKDTWTHIDTQLGIETTSKIEKLAKLRNMPNAKFKVTADDIAGTYFTQVNNTQSQLYEATLRNSIKESVKRISESAGIPLSQSISLAEQNMQIEALTGLYEAQKLIPTMKALCLAFVISLTWIMAIFSIATMNFVYLKFILTLNVWLMLWSPLYTVLNYFTELQMQSAISYYSDIGINAYNQSEIWKEFAAELSLLSKLVWSIPMLAFAVAKGSEHAMVGFISGATQVGAGAASKSASMVSGEAMKMKHEIRDQYSSHSQIGGARSYEQTQETHNGTVKTSSTTSGDSSTITAEGLGNGVKLSTSVGADGTTLASISGSSITASASATAQKNYEVASTEAREATKSFSQDNAEAIKNIRAVSNGATIKNDAGETMQVSEATQHAVVKAEEKAFQEATKATDTLKTNKDFKFSDGSSLIGTSSTSGNLKGGISAFSGADFFGNGLKATASADVAVGFKQDEQNNLQFVNSKGAVIGTSYDKDWNKSFSEKVAESFSEVVSNNESLSMQLSTAVDRNASNSSSVDMSSSEKLSEAYSRKESASESLKEAQSLSSKVDQNMMNFGITSYMNDPENFQQFKTSDGNWKNDEARKEATVLMQSKMVDAGTSDEGIQFLSHLMNKYGENSFDKLPSNIDSVDNTNFNTTVDSKLNTDLNSLNKEDILNKNNNINSEAIVNLARIENSYNEQKIEIPNVESNFKNNVEDNMQKLQNQASFDKDSIINDSPSKLESTDSKIIDTLKDIGSGKYDFKTAGLNMESVNNSINNANENKSKLVRSIKNKLGS